MKKATKLIALLLSIAVVLSLAACGGSAQPAGGSGNQEGGQTEATTSSILDNLPSETTTVNEERKSTANSDERYEKVVVAQQQDCMELQPFNNIRDLGKSMQVAAIYEPLLDEIEVGEFVGRLAKSWEEVDDTHVKVEIFDYIEDTDGNKITADDVVFSYNLVKDSGYANDFGYFESVEATGDYEVTFTWNKPIDSLTAFASMLSQVNIVSEKAYSEHDMSRDPVGTGPYKLVSFMASNSTVVEARDDYWQTDESLRSPFAKANVQTIEWDVVADAEMRKLSFQNGETTYIQLTADILADYITGQYSENANLYYSIGETNAAIECNCSENSICSNKDFRLAMFYAINSDAVSQVNGPDLYPVPKTFVPTGAGDFDPSWEDIDSYLNVYDPDLAKEYLEKSGYDGTPIKFVTNTFPLKTTSAQVIANMLGEVGINVEIVTIEAALNKQYRSDMTSWDIWNGGFGDMNYAIIGLYKSMSATQGTIEGYPNNYYVDDAFQEMLSKATSTSGYSKEATKEVIEYINDNALLYPYINVSKIYAFDPNVITFVRTGINRGSGGFQLGACDYYLD
ncbi:MAG: ABC transporter substrate-binding protein [Lachnospiraceae bacterium]|nr:ABC transporter substrate-binding protein [Lachnospiraceae bacterium]